MVIQIRLVQHLGKRTENLPKKLSGGRADINTRHKHFKLHFFFTKQVQINVHLKSKDIFLGIGVASQAPMHCVKETSSFLEIKSSKHLLIRDQLETFISNCYSQSDEVNTPFNYFLRYIMIS